MHRSRERHGFQAELCRDRNTTAPELTGGSVLARVRRLLGQPTAEFGYRNATAWLAGLVTIGFVAAALATGDAPQENLGGLDDAPVSAAENAREFRYVAQPERRVAHHYRRIAAGLPGGLTRKQLLADADPRKRSRTERRFPWILKGSGTFFGQRVFRRRRLPAEK